MENYIEQPVFDFTVIEQATGRVVSSGRTMHTEGLALPGEQVIENVKAQLGTYLSNGVFVAYPVKPNPAYEFDYVAGAWYDPRTIEQLKDDRWERLKHDRQTASDGGVTVAGYAYQTTETSVAAVTSEYVLLDDQPNDWTIDWTLQNNDVRTLDKPEFREMATAVMQHRNRCHAIGQTLRAQLFAPETNTPAEIEAVVWPVP